jgi:hypothetical protein
VIIALLGQSGAEADVFLMLNYYTRPLPESVRSQAVRRATEVLGNSSSDDKARGWAVGLLRNNTEAILALFAAIKQESSVMVRRGVVSEAARLLTEKPDLPDAGTFAERVFDLALTSDDVGVQINIISSLDAEKARDRYGAAALKVLTTLANRDENEDVRIVARSKVLENWPRARHRRSHERHSQRSRRSDNDGFGNAQRIPAA